MRYFFKSFAYAGRGLLVFFKTERNGKLELLAAAVALLFSWQLQISPQEWICITGCIALVLSFEMMNSAVEKICNLVHPAYHPGIKSIKDIAAAAVLCVCIFSAIAGAIIFLPKIIMLLC